LAQRIILTGAGEACRCRGRAKNRPPQSGRAGSRQRFETAGKCLPALERGANRPLERPPATPLAMRNPLLTWRIVAGVSLLLNLILLMLLTR
jgi:hypothetical protein